MLNIKHVNHELLPLTFASSIFLHQSACWKAFTCFKSCIYLIHSLLMVVVVDGIYGGYSELQGYRANRNDQPGMLISNAQKMVIVHKTAMRLIFP